MTNRWNNEPRNSQAQSSGNQGLARREDQRGLARRGYGYSPFDLMRRFSEDVDRFFGSFGFPMMAWPSTTAATNWSPAVDMFARGDDLVVRADLPGLRPEDMQIETEGNNLILHGQAQSERDEQGYYERSYGSFYRSIPLPEGVQTDSAQAQFNNGVLEITLPGAARTMQPQRRRIPIQGAAVPAPSQPGAASAQPASNAQNPQIHATTQTSSTTNG